MTTNQNKDIRKKFNLSKVDDSEGIGSLVENKLYSSGVNKGLSPGSYKG